jgi:TetR/AcrR family transcriptional regulator, mexCD-oprJ operon repressor
MSNLAPKTSLRERVSAAILEAAGAVLAAREQASMGEVADAAGVARATLYRYFPTREALVEALTEYALVDAGGRLDAAGLDRVPVGEGFTRAVRALVGVGDYFVVLTRERTGPARADFERQVAGPLRKLIQRGQEDGELRQDVDASWLLESLLALVATVLPSAPSLGPEDTVDAIASLFLDGARGPRHTGGT